jgi:hypothetical protein
MDPITLDRLDGAATSDDGRTVQFDVRARDGSAVAVSCGHGDLESIIHFTIQLGQLSAERRSQVAPHSLGRSDNITVSPIDTSDVGLMRAMESDYVVLVARMAGFDLGFSVTPYQLRALYKEIERVLPRNMLHADEHHHHHGDPGHDHHHGHGRDYVHGHDHGHGHHHHHHDHDHNR